MLKYNGPLKPEQESESSSAAYILSQLMLCNKLLFLISTSFTPKTLVAFFIARQMAEAELSGNSCANVCDKKSSNLSKMVSSENESALSS